MFSLSSSFHYYLYAYPTDMRCSFDSLCGLVSSSMQRDPLSGEVFIFINRVRNKIKLLHWERGGFVLYYKRLETGTLELPKISHWSTSMYIQWSDLILMIEGISVEKVKKKRRYLSTKHEIVLDKNS